MFNRSAKYRLKISQDARMPAELAAVYGEKGVSGLYCQQAAVQEGDQRSGNKLESTDIKSNSLRTRGAVVIVRNVRKRQPRIDGWAA